MRILLAAAVALFGASALAADFHPRVLLDDGANLATPNAPLGSPANPIATGKPVGAAAIAASQVSSIATTGSTATTLAAARTGAPGTGRIALTIVNTGSQTIFVGPTNAVTASTGASIAPGGSRTLETQAAVYGVVASGSSSCDILETY